MSGIEIAGLILGAVPITVQLLKQYIEARKFWLAFRNKAQHLRTLIEGLEDHAFFIRADLCTVLVSAGIDIGQRQTIRNIDLEAVAEILNDTNTRDRIVTYLGNEGYRLYIRKLERCQDLVAGLVSVRRSQTRFFIFYGFQKAISRLLYDV